MSDYTPPEGNDVILDFGGDCTPPAGDQIVPNFGSDIPLSADLAGSAISKPTVRRPFPLPGAWPGWQHILPGCLRLPRLASSPRQHPSADCHRSCRFAECWMGFLRAGVRLKGSCIEKFFSCLLGLRCSVGLPEPGGHDIRRRNHSTWPEVYFVLRAQDPLPPFRYA